MLKKEEASKLLLIKKEVTSTQNGALFLHSAFEFSQLSDFHHAILKTIE